MAITIINFGDVSKLGDERIAQFYSEDGKPYTRGRLAGIIREGETIIIRAATMPEVSVLLRKIEKIKSDQV